MSFGFRLTSKVKLSLRMSISYFAINVITRRIIMQNNMQYERRVFEVTNIIYFSN